jgi:general secretion pathway protein H
MPARRHHPRAAGGFTLLEVLMVVLVVGILSSVVVLGIGSGGAGRHLPEEGQRLAALIEQAANEAVMQNQEYGLRVTDRGYGFLCLDEAKQRWRACNDDIFRERELPEGLELRLVRAGTIKGLPSEEKDGDDRQRRQEEGDEPRITPDIFLLSSGETSAASIELRVVEDPDQRSEVSLDEVGRVSLEGAGAPDRGAGEGGNDEAA